MKFREFFPVGNLTQENSSQARAGNGRKKWEKFHGNPRKSWEKKDLKEFSRNGNGLEKVLEGKIPNKIKI